jgi:ATP/maltotriose-dependent transcriptional regulator MalT/DNA-binding SARP family transcriptional activator
VILTAGAGYGKTTILEQAMSGGEIPAAWISCSDVERAPGPLLTRIVEAVGAAVPGASDALAERLASAPERVDHVAVTRELIAELARLLVEPLVLVIDDAEHLDAADDSLSLIGELIRAEVRSLHVALAGRRQLELRLAKPRASGRLTELGAADLVFDAEECAALLRVRTGRDPGSEEVEAVMEATEGWPLGVAIAARRAEQGESVPLDSSLASLASAPDLPTYLSEELLGTLDPPLVGAAIDSSVTRLVTPAVARSLGLPPDFPARMQVAGLPVRRVEEGGEPAFAYHPLVREFLLERARERGVEEWRRLHALVAPAVAEAGDAIEAIEHWLEAERWPDAVKAIEREGPMLVRTSPLLMERWFSLLPGEVRELPAMQALEGQLQWAAGQHEKAVGPLRKAVAGHHETGETEREWVARFFLAEALFSAGGFEEMLGLAEGWDGPGVRANVSAAGVAWYKVLALAALGRSEEAEGLARQLRRDVEVASRFQYLDELASLMADLARGTGEEALTRLLATLGELELGDPIGRLPVTRSVVALVQLDIGQTELAMESLRRCGHEAEELGLGFVARDAHLQLAALLARRGELAAAETELERAGPRPGTGWRGVSRHTAEAEVAAERGDAEQAVAAAERALARVRPGLVCFRVWAALEMATVLADNRSSDRARSAIEEAVTAVDEHYPGDRGRYHRARLTATLACLQHGAGERDSANENLRAAWAEAGERAHLLARAHWPMLRPVLWGALADEALDPADILPALDRALPGGAALIAFVDHPRLAVRSPARSAALGANHPAALSRLAELADDSDERVASAATATRERLRDSPPPLKFMVLGPFRVMRAGWAIDGEAWRRPIDARLVRFLLVHGPEPVQEDLIFEALWPGKSGTGARRSLQVAVSGARRVLDPPGAERSTIESGGHSYRLAVGERDGVDAREFGGAAELALASDGEDRQSLLERARSLWGGEPLPEERYSDWATSYRERLIDRYIAVLTALGEIHGRAGEHPEAANLARELVDVDPLNEGGHRALMIAYARSGRTGHALRQYLECRRALVEELGVEPAEQTSRLQARILAGESI